MNTTDMLTYRKGTTMQRQIAITTEGSESLVIEFKELEGHKFNSKYYLIVEPGELTSVKINLVLRAWLENDTGLFNHPGLTMTDEG